MNRRRFAPTICLLALILNGCAQRPVRDQTAPMLSNGPVALGVSGVGITSRNFTQQGLGSLPRAAATVKEQSGQQSIYEGVRVGDVLKSLGMEFGHALRGPRLADFLLVEAADGYRVVFALPELDPEFSDRVVLLADRCNGAPIAAKDGPFKIIVSDERRHARWVRNVTRLTVQSAVH